jgi:hypothetical protein
MCGKPPFSATKCQPRAYERFPAKVKPMTQEEFQALVSQEPALAGPIHRAAAAGTPATYGTPLLEGAALALMFPLVSFIVTQTGLPWLHEAQRYTELWRLKFHQWIDGQYRQAGFDPDQAEVVGGALRAELERTTDANARAAWERLRQLLTKDAGSP